MDLLIEEVKGQDAIAQDGIVKLADIEFGAEELLRFGAEVANLKLADFVGAGILAQRRGAAMRKDEMEAG